MKIAWSNSVGALLLLMLATSGYSNVEIEEKCSQVEAQPVALTVGLEGQASEAGFKREAQLWLQVLAENPPSFYKILANVFGDSYDTIVAEKLRARMSAGDFSWMPVVQIVLNETMPYAAAAYSEKDHRVYVNEIISNTPLRAFAYLEEVGHYLDAVLNERDTPGDEGEHFMRLVTGQSHRQSLRPETGTIVVDGRMIEVEFGWLDDVWDAIKGVPGWTWDRATWTWEQIESATDWVLGGVEDTWDWLKKNINWKCVASGLGVATGCAVCIASVIAAPETAGGSLVVTKEVCGIGCVAVALAVANDCASTGATTEATEVGKSQGELKRSIALPRRPLARVYDGANRNGDWQAFPIGIWDVHSLVYLRNDQASSVAVDPGVVARLCAEDGMWGDCFDFHQGQDESTWFRSYAQTLNNRVSSLSVTPGVTVYQHPKFEGKRWTYTPGSYNHTAFRNVLNDQLSSLVTAPGILVQLCSESGGGGRCITVEGGTSVPTLPEGMNDRTSNIVVSKGMTVYTDAQFRGRRKTFAPGTYDVSALGEVGNDSISSLVVPLGLEARLCSEAGGSGECRTFRGNVSFVGPDMDNRTSWLRVTTVDHSFLRRPIGTLPMTLRVKP